MELLGNELGRTTHGCDAEVKPRNRDSGSPWGTAPGAISPASPMGLVVRSEASGNDSVVVSCLGRYAIVLRRFCGVKLESNC
jgi:hypothetical protein